MGPGLQKGFGTAFERTRGQFWRGALKHIRVTITVAEEHMSAPKPGLYRIYRVAGYCILHMKGLNMLGWAPIVLVSVFSVILAPGPLGLPRAAAAFGSSGTLPGLGARRAPAPEHLAGCACAFAGHIAG